MVVRAGAWGVRVWWCGRGGVCGWSGGGGVCGARAGWCAGWGEGLKKQDSLKKQTTLILLLTIC